MRAVEFIIENTFISKRQEINYIYGLNGSIPSETWCQLVEQHFHQTTYLSESLDRELVSQIQSCEKAFSIEPVLGKKYIPVPIFLLSGNLQILDTNGSFPALTSEFNTLTKINADSLEFISPHSKASIWPYNRLSKLGYMTVILADSEQTYNKLRTWIELKFDRSLPPLSDSSSLNEQLLDEAATAIVYHYCGVPAAAKILTTGVFQLSSVTGNKSEEQYAPAGYPYFLSTTRSKVGDYHRYTGSSAVMFVLDGNWLNQRYKTNPVDYWERAWQHSGGSRTSESEDRVFSKTPDISVGGVRAVHVLLKEQSENRSPEVRTILINAKKRGIAAYLYTDEKAWRLQDTRKAVSPASAAPLLKGQQTKGYTPSRPQTMYLEPWLELIYKNKKADLSPRAEKLRYDLVYYGSRYRDQDSNLGTDMSNARKPNSNDYPMAVKINNYMRKNKFANTVALKNALVDKWENIK